ncbi:hypothetical protein QJS04_geneDACA004589 [Acorus gramineus]|uniref:Protein TAPETUM DETERMINANT 1-like n=1 Tax=Acorus gramineus TaxID=55184 RepID=A0AAV9BSE8_ACOGR|nr:hypothetical protein QJS04_geneDACA004589 [Acorus gramineus]
MRSQTSRISHKKRQDNTIIMSSSLLLFFHLMMLLTSVCHAELHYLGLSNTTMHEVQEDNNNSLRTHGRCTNRDISISQSRDTGAPGIPQYIVQIVNTCVFGCAPSDIHLHCGWFASARIVNPRTFKRVSFDDCLVNGGRPLRSSQTIRFTYSNSFVYPLRFRSARFC